MREDIIKMITDIKSECFIKMIYGFVRRLHREEKGGFTI